MRHCTFPRQISLTTLIALYHDFPDRQMFKRFGRTVRLTATEDAWAAPTMMALEGGSFGLQIGAEETDFVLLVINESGAREILAGKVKLDGDASIAAGLVCRDASAETDVTMRSEILSYSHARGVFAGISLEALPSVRIMMPTRRSTARNCPPGTSCFRTASLFQVALDSSFPHWMHREHHEAVVNSSSVVTNGGHEW